jgi:hypothetical protein
LLKLKKKTKILFIIIVLLSFSGIISYPYICNVINNQKDAGTEKNEQINSILDNRISPLVNQGLILEINRIRNRGLLDIIMKSGNNWKNKPLFFIETNIDGLKYISDHFNTWDTKFQGFRIIKDAEEEQQKSTIKITIIEKKNNFLRTEDMEKEKINLIYDYRTGRWSGDDFFRDTDGYGHYIGKYYEIWFNIYQTDYNHDGIPYWTEVNILHVSPYEDNSKLDPDGDGIPTSWEWKWGYNANIWDDHAHLDPDMDGLTNIEEYKMTKWYADPFTPDIYLESDGMQKKGFFDWNHVFYEESQQIMIERFCRHNINLYIDNGWPTELVNGGGELLPHVNILSWNSGSVTQFYNYHFADERKGIFRYLIICDSAGPSESWSGNTIFNRYDTIVCGNNAKMIFIYQRAFTARTQRVLMAAIVLHELGHTLGIEPYTIEGCDNVSFLIDVNSIGQMIKKFKNYINEWGNYKSVMNYLYVFDKNLVDYSDGSNGFNDQNDWEKFYLPFFKIENNVICEPGILPPATDKVIDKNVSIVLDGWQYSKNLTQLYINRKNGSSPINPIKCDYKVFIKNKNASYPSNRDVRVYARPLVPISGLSLIEEAYLDDFLTG